MGSLKIRKDGALYSIAEEIANAVIHGVGAMIAVAGFVILVVFSVFENDSFKLAGSIVYGISMVILFTMSTLYHSLTNTKVKKVFRVFDHTSIFLLIAGTYTPYTLVTLRGVVGWTLFGVVWGACILGIVFNSISVEKFKKFSMICYIASGWSILIAFYPLYMNLSFPGIAFLITGGIFYTIGIIFYIKKKICFMHSIWHLFVLAGAVFHFFSILFYVILY